jgi:hypothetical protein
MTLALISMNYADFKNEQIELEARIREIKAEPYFQDAWVGQCRSGGNARGRIATQYQLRSRQAIFEGKKSCYLKATELEEARTAVRRGRELKSLERRLRQVNAQITEITLIAKQNGLSMPKITNFEALTQSKSNEWYTKSCYIELARTVLGKIDLDPASNSFAQSWIQASVFFTKDDDGFSKPWHGRIWLNPPYGTSRPNASDWMLKAISEFDAGRVIAAILLVRGDSKGIKQLESRYPCCNPNHRIAFIDASGQEQPNPPPGYRFFYLGPNVKKFKQVFSAIGSITIPA